MNDTLKKLITEISSHATTGRGLGSIVTLKPIKEVAPPPPPPDEEDPKKKDAASDDGGQDIPPPPPADVPSADAAPSPEGDSAPKEPAKEPDAEDVVKKAEDAEQDAEKVQKQAQDAKQKAQKAALQKKEAEKSIVRSKKEILINVLLKTALADAIAKNKLDALAATFQTALQLNNPKDLQQFLKDTASLRNIRGYKELVQSLSKLLPPPQEQEPTPTNKG